MTEADHPIVIMGQHWREVDPRVDRVVEVLGVSINSVYIRRIHPGGVGRATWAQRSRFNGKRGGYRLIEKSEEF